MALSHKAQSDQNTPLIARCLLLIPAELSAKNHGLFAGYRWTGSCDLTRQLVNACLEAAACFRCQRRLEFQVRFESIIQDLHVQVVFRGPSWPFFSQAILPPRDMNQFAEAFSFCIDFQSFFSRRSGPCSVAGGQSARRECSSAHSLKRAASSRRQRMEASLLVLHRQARVKRCRQRTVLKSAASCVPDLWCRAVVTVGRSVL